MVIDSFKKALDDLKTGIEWMKKNHAVSMAGKGSLKNFKETQLEYHKTLVNTSIVKLNSLIWELYNLKRYNHLVDHIGTLLVEVEGHCKNDRWGSCNTSIKAITDLLSNIKDEKEQAREVSFRLPKLPDEIRSAIVSDVQEMQKCYKQELFRSAAILCGRILEVALHRKYFEVTGVDVLEKHPEIGLGNLIAKLVEKGVHFDPGLTQQIHLINQVRVHSVHKKQDTFQPSKMQTQAMILYTMDALEKLFR